MNGQSTLLASIPTVIPDEMWVAEGQVAIPSDRPLGRSVSGHTYGDEVFIISASRDPLRVRRMTKSTTTRFDPDYGWITTADCLWVGDEPFAVMVHKTVRQPDDGKPQFARKMAMAIFWSHQSLNGGEIKKFIEVADLPVTTAPRAPHEVLQWVRLDHLSEQTGIAPSELRRGFLVLSALSDQRQRNCVFAEDEIALTNGPLDRMFEVEGTNSRRPTGFPSKDPNSEVPATQVWVALSAAVNVLRLISLGVREHLDLFPTRFI